MLRKVYAVRRASRLVKHLRSHYFLLVPQPHKLVLDVLSISVGETISLKGTRSMHKPLVPKTDQADNGRQSLALDDSPHGEETAVMAYRLWEKRGRPEGSPDADWYRAEQELALRPETS